MTQAPSPSALNALLCFNTYTLNRAFGRYYQRAFSETGLTYPKFVILMVLQDAGPLSVTDLSARAGVEPNTLSPLLKKMAGFGVLTRERTPEDERRVSVAITELGRRLLDRARDVVMEGFAEIDLDTARVTETLGFMEEVRQRLDAAEPPKLQIKDITG